MTPEEAIAKLEAEYAASTLGPWQKQESAGHLPIVAQLADDWLIGSDSYVTPDAAKDGAYILSIHEATPTLLTLARVTLETVERMPKGTPDSLGGRLAAALAALGEAVS